MNPIYENEWVQLYQGDCLEIMPQLNIKFDACITDLPYGMTDCKWDSVIPFEPMWNNLKHLIRQNGAICLFGKEPFSSKLVCSQIEGFSHSWVWIKKSSAGFLNSKKMPLKAHENINVFYVNDADFIRYFLESKKRSNLTNKEVNVIIGCTTKNGGGLCSKYWNDIQFNMPTRDKYDKLYAVGFFDLSYDEMLKRYRVFDRVFNPQKTEGKPYQQKQCGTSHIYNKKIKIEIVNNGDRCPISWLMFNRDAPSLHPTQKPVALIEYLVKTYTNENELVLDFTSGSGTTGIACMNTNRHCVLIEKEPKYCEITIQRLKNKEKEMAERLF